MTYRKNRKPFEELSAVVLALHENRETTILHTENPQRLTYRLREVLYSCQFHEDLRRYAFLGKLYAFELHSTFVRARYRGSDDVTKIEIRPGERGATRTKGGRKSDRESVRIERDIPPPEEPETPEEELDELDKTLSTATVPGVSSLMGIIEGMKRYGARVMDVYFPEAHLSVEDLTRLYWWTIENGWGIIDMEDAGLTVSKRVIEEGLEWKPPQT